MNLDEVPEVVLDNLLESYFQGKIEKKFEGNSGKVYLVKNNCFSPEYNAYKKCKGLEEDSIDLFKEEVFKWNQIRSRYIVPIYYMHTVFGEYYACMRACKGSLEEFLKNEVTEIAAYNYSLQIIKGLLDMNDSGLLHHQDFNPQNILYEDLSELFRDFPPQHFDDSHRYRMMISDFAMSNYYLKNNIDGKAGGKFPFKAPEQYKNSDLMCFQPDRFALGVLLCLLFSNKHPCGHSAAQVLKKNPKKIKGGWENWAKNGERVIQVKNKKLKKLIEKLLLAWPSQRPSFSDCFAQIQSEYESYYPEQAKISINLINCSKDEYDKVPRENLRHKYHDNSLQKRF
ncbi:MAG: protein kinase [Cyanobacteria bacterium P01_F01_bin.143]